MVQRGTSAAPSWSRMYPVASGRPWAVLRAVLPVPSGRAAEQSWRSVARGHGASMTGASRPFRVLGLQQVAVGAESKDDMRRIWQDLLGLHKHGEFRSEKENVDEDILVMGRGLATVEVDIMAPLDIAKSPKVHTPNLNHIGLWIDDLDSCVTWLQGHGVRFAGGIRVGAAGHKVAFIHPKGNTESPVGGAGVLIELVQAPANIIRSFEEAPDF